MGPPFGEYLSALSSRLSRTWRSRPASVSIVELSATARNVTSVPAARGRPRAPPHLRHGRDLVPAAEDRDRRPAAHLDERNARDRLGPGVPDLDDAARVDEEHAVRNRVERLRSLGALLRLVEEARV